MRFFLASLGALAMALTSVANASAEQQQNPFTDQGSSPNYRSLITSVDPRVPGLELQVLQFSDRLQLRNRTGKTITVLGYQNEPYARVQANGTVEVNTRSPAYFLNQSFYAQVNVPASVTPTTPPHWTVVDRTGVLEWHDHRIHWMSPVTPAKVKDKNRRTFIFKWNVPIEVGSHTGAINGQLFWVPENSKAPTGAIVGLVLFTLLAAAFVLFLRRRRSRQKPGSKGSGTSRSGDGRGGLSPDDERLGEAW